MYMYRISVTIEETLPRVDSTIQHEVRALTHICIYSHLKIRALNFVKS